MPRVDGYGKVVGGTIYATDLVLPHMLEAKLLLSPHAHARILRIDSSRALAMPGVRAIVTAADTPQVRVGPYIKDRVVFARHKVCYVGEPVAAVAAVDRETAEAALRLIEVEYEPLPAVLDPEEALRDDAPQVHEDIESFKSYYPCPKHGNVAQYFELALGEVEAAFARADHIFERTFTTQPSHHCFIEPFAAVAQVDAAGRVTIHSSTQQVAVCHAETAESLGLPLSKVRVIATAVGGGFGGKCDSFIEPIVALLAQKTRRPVRLVLTREESFLCARPNPPFKITLRLGVNRDGALVAGYSRLLTDTGAYTNHVPGVIGVAATFPFGAYHVPHAKVEATCVYTHKTAFGCMKGYGMPQSTFAMESMLDIIAAELQLDPLALRLRNVFRAGDKFITGQVLPTSTATEALLAVAEAADWEGRRRNRQPNRGLGIAAQILHIGLQSAAAFVKVNMDGTVGVITSLQDIGTGAITGLAQIVADTLGVTVEEVIFSAPDSDSTPFDIGVIANRVIFDAGTAIHSAALEVKQQLLARASEHLGEAPEQLELAGGRVRVKVEPERAISLAHLAEESNLAKWGPLIGKGSLMSSFAPEEVIPGYPHSPSRTHAFGAHVAEVEVDPETGQVTVLDYVACHDVGKAINPAGIIGQIEGGVAQGIGWTLVEGMLHDEQGRLRNPSFLDYRLLTAADLPPIRPVILEIPEYDMHPYGAKGIGQCPIIPVAGAIANAIAAAVGVRVTALPITPDKIVAAINNQSPQIHPDKEIRI